MSGSEDMDVDLAGARRKLIDIMETNQEGADETGRSQDQEKGKESELSELETDQKDTNGTERGQDQEKGEKSGFNDDVPDNQNKEDNTVDNNCDVIMDIPDGAINNTVSVANIEDDTVDKNHDVIMDTPDGVINNMVPV
ncbi:hypothetical protein JR316_0013296 [Psilocybe cubensis]|uniref:Uncharacterized protein n=1 Tax=Psilocybe cubensis TaxID=181762 RepID=A0ACB8GID6_PSICU|nr:hypothetical protein JR316_0013296 [Psilocybe cubensis]KAH9474830.1 hypothetical protein JR316_0013296 [Psilocybe cubensis]